jgi:hypothetical protein
MFVPSRWSTDKKYYPLLIVLNFNWGSGVVLKVMNRRVPKVYATNKNKILYEEAPPHEGWITAITGVLILILILCADSLPGLP